MIPNPILITGSGGQLGTVLYAELASLVGSENVIATDIVQTGNFERFELLDIREEEQIRALVKKYDVRSIFHLAAILSAKGEMKPKKAWHVNMDGLINVLEISVQENVERVFFPSSIAVFGSDIPLHKTPQHVPLYPKTVYGISKAAGENWCSYYYANHGLDVRSVRYPGVVGYQSMPGGGTTDYAVEIFHAALRNGKFECFLDEGASLPMIYMEDAIRATIEIMEADADNIKIRTSYNLQGLNFSPGELAAEIRKHIPEFKISYKPDFRQKIASSWPDSIDDSNACQDWGWKPKFNIESMTKDMLEHLHDKYSVKF
jgi:nucleoside-diphosphate-sugar epimerase